MGKNACPNCGGPTLLDGFCDECLADKYPDVMVAEYGDALLSCEDTQEAYHTNRICLGNGKYRRYKPLPE